MIAFHFKISCQWIKGKKLLEGKKCHKELKCFPLKIKTDKDIAKKFVFIRNAPTYASHSKTSNVH